MPYIREDQADIRITVDGVPYGGSWASVEGANLESNDSKTRPGGMGSEVPVGGPSSRDDCTVTIQFSDVVAGWHKKLEQAVRNDAPMKVSYTFLHRRAPVGPSHTVVGIIKSARLPNFDSNGNEQSFYTVVMSCAEEAA